MRRPFPLRRSRSLRRDTGGGVMIEFAFVAPVLLIAGLGSLELANLTLAYMRVSDIAIKVADNSARVRVSIDESDINEIFTGAKEMGKPINFAANGRIILSSVEPLVGGTPPKVTNQYLRWQRCTGAYPVNSTHGSEGDGATGTGQAAGYGVPGGGKIQASMNSAVMLAEVVYKYQPLISDGWFGPIVIRQVKSMPVRQRTDQIVKNGSNLPAASRMLCSNPYAA